MNKEDQILDILAMMQGEMQKMNAKIDNIDTRVTKADIRSENEIMPKINALYEGQATIKEMLTPRSKIDELEDRVKFLEAMMRQMASEMQKAN